ncbi:hypothetical protein FBQ87_05675 [Sphingobacteriales bacterium CHB3]|nr:hypothetical protein [Sphingobacteriales bacterium CHB3]
MKIRAASVLAVTVFVSASLFAQNGKKQEVSFKNDVFPIIKAKCLPCHAEDNFNPSELNMDSYDQIAAGGKHGVPFKVGKSSESLLIQKLAEKPPFGDRMPLNSKRRIQEGKAVWLTEDELKAVATWIDQGAKNN